MKIESSDATRALKDALYRIFRAIARIALKRGLPYEAVADLAKRAFIDVARREFTIPGRKQSASRISVVTGIHRKDVARMSAIERAIDETAASRITSVAGILTGWRRDRHFLDKRGRPVALPFDKGSPSFMELVRRHGKGDPPGRAVLDELIRVGAVTKLRDGRLRLVATAYVPATGSTETLEILGSDVSDLLSAIDHNMSSEPEVGFFHRRVTYDNLPSEALPGIRERVRRDGQAVLEKYDRNIAKHDRDINPRASGTGRKRVLVEVFYFEDDVPQE